MVFQSYALFPHMSVLDNVRYGLTREPACADEADARARRCGDGQRRPGRLRRRACRASCRAASSSAWRWRARWCWSRAVLLFDEPLSNLDARLRRRCARRSARCSSA